MCSRVPRANKSKGDNETNERRCQVLKIKVAAPRELWQAILASQCKWFILLTALCLSRPPNAFVFCFVLCRPVPHEVRNGCGCGPWVSILPAWWLAKHPRKTSSCSSNASCRCRECLGTESTKGPHLEGSYGLEEPKTKQRKVVYIQQWFCGVFPSASL